MASPTQAFRFVPDAFVAPLVVFAVPFVFVLAMVGLDFEAVRRSPVEHGALLAVFVTPFVVSVVVAVRRRALTERMARGELRLGLFLEPEQLVLALPGEAPAVVPRAAITAVAAVRRDFGKRRPTPDTVCVTSDAGVLDVPAEQLEHAGGAQALCERVEAWRRG